MGFMPDANTYISRYTSN